MSQKIPTSLLFCTTVAAAACTKSNEQLAEDICEKMTCLISEEDRESYGDELATYIEECATEGLEYLDAMEGECTSVTRDYYICISNLNCAQYEEVVNGDDHPCQRQEDAFGDCEGYDDETYEYDYAVYEEDQYEPDNTIDEATEILANESQERTFHDGGDIDVVRFEATEGKSYTLETSIADGDATDTVLSLYENFTELLAENDDNIEYESLIEWTASSTGTYIIEVTPLNAGPYVLRITEN
jgi:hypothetical protein